MKFIDPRHDPWQLLPADPDAATDGTTKPRLLTLAQWRQRQQEKQQQPSSPWHDAAGEPAAPAAGHDHNHLGVVLPNDADERELLPDLPRLSLVALQFPKWTDGRAYSQARTLRARLGFRGEIRATGEVLVDMLPLLQRTGFDAVELRADQRLDSAQRALRFFARHYQGDTQEAVAPFHREAVAA